MARKPRRKKDRPIPGGITRPGRYVGREWNLPSIPSETGFRVVLCYPDVYEIGMSHYGLQVMYQILRNLPGITVERVFAVWPDKAAEMRRGSLPLCTLETGTPLAGSDVICFTLPHELSYTNVLTILDLGGIPLERTRRTSQHPVILGGGITTMNPLPLDRFFDGFLIGEAEDVLGTIIRTLRNTPKSDLPAALSAIPGMYLPGLYPGEKYPETCPAINKQFTTDFDSAPFPDPPLVPMCRPVHERVVVECARGCPRTCRFCQARVYYAPVRRRRPETVIQIARKNLRQTGYEEVSLLSLNIADYPGIESLLLEMMPALEKDNVSISLPSLRPEKLTASMIAEIRRVRKTGFTLAPEAGSDNLRHIIGKPYERERLLNSTRAVFHAGWNVLKLYFMIGLPFETDNDVRGIVRLVHDILNIGQAIAGKRVKINVSVGIFVPKPHTPFQWVEQASRDDILRRQRILRIGCHSQAIKLSLSDLFTSRLEAYFARGDRTAADVLVRACENGCGMDAWNEHLKPEAWQRAFEAAGISLEDTVTRAFPVNDTPLPWTFINSGVPRESLLQEYRKASHQAVDLAEEQPRQKTRGVETRRNHHDAQPIRNPQTLYRYIGIFQVLSDYRLFSHMEVTVAMARSMRRAGIPLGYSLGFNPHPKMTLMNPAPLGFERWFEPVVFDLTEQWSETDVLHRLNLELPPEMTFRWVRETGTGKPLKPLQQFAVALKFVNKSEKRRANISMPDIVDFLNPECFGQEIESRFKEKHMDLLCVFPKEARQDMPFRDFLKYIYGEKGMPLDAVYGVRIGWLSGSDTGSDIFGLDAESERS